MWPKRFKSIRLNHSIGRWPHVAKIFHRSSSLTPFAPRANMDPDPLGGSEADGLAEKNFTHFDTKIYCGPGDTTAKLVEILNRRRTVTRFEPDTSPTDALPQIISGSIGVNGRNLTAKEYYKDRRPYPSAGATYPLETYLFVNRASNLLCGLYYFKPSTHELILLSQNEFSKDLFRAFCGQQVARDSSGIIVFTNVQNRISGKYGERGYRFALIEAGHACQNVLIMATELGLGAVPLGGFFDDELGALMGLDTSLEVPLYAVAIGFSS